MKKVLLKVAGMALLMVSAAAIQAADAVVAKPELWTHDFAAAKAQAAKEGKDLFVDFTGSDWCGWCIKLKSEVFDTPEFVAAAPKDFVLVELDFPRDKKKISAETAAQNEQLAKTYGVRGYPSIYLMDVQGRPYAKLGYQPGGAVPYLETMKKSQEIRKQRDDAWKKAESAAGVEKAKLLAQGLAVINDELVGGSYGAIFKEIKTLDPQDSTGIVREFEFNEKLGGLVKSVQSTLRETKDPAAAEKLIDDFVTVNNATGKKKQSALMMKLNLYPPRSLANLDRVAKLLDEVIAIDPATDVGKGASAIKPKLAGFREKILANPPPASKSDKPAKP